VEKAMELFEMVWKIAYEEPKIDFKPRTQFVDAAQSISSNIAQGYGRRSVKEYVLYVALGSLAETLTRGIGLDRTGQLSHARIRDFDLLHYEVENRLLRLIEKLEQNVMMEIGSRGSPRIHPNTPSLHHSTNP
jgi:four helix bundle protein